ncbi:MAG: glycosyltransferase [Bacteroidota bacterium]|nr:glycosyltransferase [Bacteroidota bacterium]MDP4233212.1 glycosyltransferase [Bacteroidota bacterium]MDP4242169.1 glycosyltransferase [Bacteroidota bacterium]MDP4287819.1 glycosyltransferase [Bacteroidota bacterium]
MNIYYLSGLFLLAVLIYFVEHALYAIGVFRAMREPSDDLDIANRDADLSPLPSCTVLVCARDEELNIDRCLASLEKIDYPKDRLQVLIVDDKSTDRTPQILEAWKQRMPNLQVLRTGEEIMHMRGKVNALTQGMDHATGEFVMITDADSHVRPNWVRQYLKYYHDDTGMVASITLLDVKYFLDGIQSIDWSYLLGLAMASANVNIPLSVIGNNISVRRAAYEDVGGYRTIPFSVTEDYALFQAIWRKKPWKVSFPLHGDLTVMSQPCPNFRAWWRQKHRWVKGGESLKALGYLIFIIGLLGHAAMIAALFVLPVAAALAVIAIKWSADLLIILPVLTRTSKQSLLKFFPIYEVYLALFIFSMPIMMMQKNVKWKGRVYKH